MYLAKHITQLNSGKCRRTNCWAAVGAYLVDMGTRGCKRPTPAQFRRKAGVTTCRTGGLGDVLRGLAAYGVDAKLVKDRTRAQLRYRFSRKGEPRKVYALAFDFEAWPEDKQCVRYDGYHMVAVISGLNKRKRVRTMDPLCDRIRWVKRGDVIDAAKQYAREHGQRRVDMVEVKVPK